MSYVVSIYRTAIKDRIVGFLLFMGKIFIVGIITVLGYLGFGQYEEQGRVLWQRELNYYLVPLLVSYVIKTTPTHCYYTNYLL